MSCEWLLEPLAYPMLARGLAAAVLIGVVCAVVGTFVVLKGMAFFGDALAHSMTVGLATIPDQARLLAPPPETGPAPEVFYAQLQVAKRAKEWGQAAFDEQLDAAWDRYLTFADTWLQLERGRGADAVEAAWQELLAGGTDPAAGHDLGMWPDGDGR